MANIPLPHDHGNQPVKNMPAISDFSQVSDICKQLSDPSRLRIFWVLCHYRECVINISAMVEMSSPAVSHHLRQLKVAGLIISQREGKEVYYQAADTPQARLMHRVVKEILEISCPGTCILRASDD